MPKIIVVYLSTSGNTKAMADAIALGSSTFHYKMLPPMEKFIDTIAKTNVKAKVGAAFGSYGWSGEAPVLLAEQMRKIGINVIDPVLRIQYGDFLISSGSTHKTPKT